MTRIVRYTPDPELPSSISEEERSRLLALSDAVDDAAIDTSDIPELDDGAWKNAERGRFYRPVKKQVTVRLDTSVLDWFKRRAKNGKGYQTDINAALRAYISEQEKKTG